MTALCGGGPSQRKPETPLQGYFVGNALENMVQAALGVSEFWAGLIVLLVQVGFDWDDLCGTDPPPMPSFTALEIAQLVALPIADVGLPYEKLGDLVRIAAWHYGCQCTGAPAPPKPPYPAIPADAPRQDTPGPVPGVSGPCSDVTSSVSLPADPTGVGAPRYVTPQFLPGTDITDLSNSQGGLTPGRALPQGVTVVNITGTRTEVGPRNGGVGVVLEFFTSAKTTTGQIVIDPDRGASFGGGVPVPTGSAFYQLWVSNASTTSSSTWTMHVQLTCTGGGGAIETPCCPPDASLMAAIRQILLQVQSDHDLLLNVQRYGVPFGWIQGARHSGFTGTGSFSIPRLVGMRVEVTAHPAGNQTFSGVPTYISDLGWISVESEDGFIDEIRLTRTTQNWLSRLFQTGSTFGYALREGVTANFVELEAEH